MLLLLAAGALLAASTVFVAVPRGVEVGSIGVTSPTMAFDTASLTYTIDLVAEVPVHNPNWVSAVIEGNLSVSYYEAEAGRATLGPARVPARTRSAGGWNGAGDEDDDEDNSGGGGGRDGLGKGKEGFGGRGRGRQAEERSEDDDDDGGKGGDKGGGDKGDDGRSKKGKRGYPPLRVHIDASSLPRKFSPMLFSACFTYPRELVFFLRGSFVATTRFGFKQKLPIVDTYLLVPCTAPKPSPSPSPSPSPAPPPVVVEAVVPAAAASGPGGGAGVA